MNSPNFIDLSGKKFSHLTAIRKLPRAESGSKKTMWECRCDCGSVTVVNAHSLRNELIQSCGCMKAAALSRIHRRHGGSGTITYKSWSAMMRRCHNPKDDGYSRYGGSGITVDPRWHDYPTFLSDMGPRPTPAHSIDRIRNESGYAPGNCRWATDTEQARNQKCSKAHSAYGLTMHIAEWASLTGIQYSTLRSRVYTKAMPLADAIRMKPRSILRTLLPIEKMPFAQALRDRGADFGAGPDPDD